MTVHGEIDVFDAAVCAEDFAEVGFVNVFGEFFHYNLDFLAPRLEKWNVGSYLGAFWCKTLASTPCVASIFVFPVSTRASAA